MVPDEFLGQTSLLTERRQQLSEKAKAVNVGSIPAVPIAPLAPAGPVVNFNFPPELFQLFQGQRMQPQPPTATTNETVVAPTPSPHRLFSPQQLEFIGPRMTISEFRSVYNLSDELEQKLIAHGYNSTHTLRFATIEDLQSIGLFKGEFAQLQDAISRWCKIDT